MLRVQKFLKTHSLEELREDPYNLHVTAKGDLILLKYNQFKSNLANLIVQECRGIILEKDTWKIVCHPYHKFFNMGEPNAYALLDLNDAHVFEKVDGSIIKVYHYADKWHVATNGTIDAGDATNNDDISFDTLFFDILSVTEFEKLTCNFNKENTYLFEIIHPSAQIVVDYKGKKEFVFTGMIKNEADEKGKAIDYDILSVRKLMEKTFGKLPIRYPRVFELSDVKDVSTLSDIANDENVNGNTFEGFVVAKVYNGRVINRVKIKSPDYLTLHRMATGESVTNKLITVLLNNDMDEFEVYLKMIPVSIVDEYNGLKTKYFKLIRYLYEEGAVYKKNAEDMSRKELALLIQSRIKRHCTGFIFTMIDNPTVTPEDLVRKLGVKKLKLLLM